MSHDIEVCVSGRGRGLRGVLTIVTYCLSCTGEVGVYSRREGRVTDETVGGGLQNTGTTKEVG